MLREGYILYMSSIRNKHSRQCLAYCSQLLGSMCGE